jgi:hypothetical protein
MKYLIDIINTDNEPNIINDIIDNLNELTMNRTSKIIITIALAYTLVQFIRIAIIIIIK